MKGMLRTAFIAICLATLQCDAQTIETLTDGAPNGQESEFEDSVPMPRSGSSRGATALPVVASLSLGSAHHRSERSFLDSAFLPLPTAGSGTLQNLRIRLQV